MNRLWCTFLWLGSLFRGVLSPPFDVEASTVDKEGKDDDGAG